MATPAKAPAKPASKIPVKAPVARKTPASVADVATVVQAATLPAKADKVDKVDKAKKPKLVRDSFTIPKSEYAVLEALKARAAKGGAPSKKSELLRAGIKALAAMPEAEFMAAMGAVPAIKTGRPAGA